MTIPGYDPEDLDDALEAMLSRSDVTTYLTDGELRRYDAGESPVDLLDDGDIHRLLDEGRDDGVGEGKDESDGPA